MKIKNIYTFPNMQKQTSFLGDKDNSNNNEYDKICENLEYNKMGIYTSNIDKMPKYKEILKKFDDIEKKDNVKIIYAGELGSRAWGSDSKYSDYDVRYLYVSPKSRYLNNPSKDYINTELNETYDIVGFDISKVINMHKNGDRTLYELLNSPVKYKETNFSKELKDIVSQSCDMNEFKKHYMSSAEFIYNNKIKKDDEKVSIKAYLLALRCILAADYIDKNETLPPLGFKDLFNSGLKNKPDLYDISTNLLKMKRNNKKDIVTKPIPVLDDFIASKLDELNKSEIKNSDNLIGADNIDKFFEETINSPQFAEINKIRLTPIEKERLGMFTGDIEYKKQLVQELGLPEEDFLSVHSIVGPEEFEFILNKYNSNPDVYSVGETIDAKTGKSLMKNVIDKSYRANLHIHTKNSDGEMGVVELLDSAAKYANGVAKHFEKKGIYDFEPFTIAITDHNTTKGAQEAVKIIQSNPEKYKNLRVVLGAELSAVEKDCFDKNRQIHILAQGINPFDKYLNDKLEEKMDVKYPYYKPLGSIEDVVSIVNSQPNCILGYAHPLEHLPKKMTNSDKEKVVINLVDKFNNVAKNHCRYIENYYQAYETNPDKELLQTIKEYSDKSVLYNAGGYDTHGKSIYSHK